MTVLVKSDSKTDKISRMKKKQRQKVHINNASDSQGKKSSLAHLSERSINEAKSTELLETLKKSCCQSEISTQKKPCNAVGKIWQKWNLDWLCLGVTVFITILLYSNTFNAPFYLDDEKMLTDPGIQLKTLSMGSLKTAAFDNMAPSRPIPNLTFAFNYYFNGMKLKGYHLVNLFIHLLAGVALFYFLKLTLRLSPQSQSSLSNSSIIPFVAALLWSVHPLQIQSVTYIYQRMNSLAALFFLLSLIFYVLGRHQKKPPKKYGLFITSALCALLGIASKEQVVVLPLIIVLYEWYFFQDMRTAWLKQHKIPLATIFILPLVVFLIISKGDPMQIIATEYSRYDFNAPQRLMTEMRVLIFYLSLFFYPHPSRLNLEHDFSLSTSLVHPISTLPSLGLIVGLIAFSIYIARKERLISFCILWFFITHLIESTIIPLELVYEHRNYIPSMLVLFLIVVASYRVTKFRYAKFVIPCLLILVFSFWTHQRNALWANKVQFYEDSVAKTPNFWRVWDSLGLAYFTDWQDDKAIEAYKKSISLRDNIWWPHQNLANVLNRQGQHQEALDHLMITRNLLANDTSPAMQERRNRVLMMIKSTQTMLNSPPRAKR